MKKNRLLSSLCLLAFLLMAGVVNADLLRFTAKEKGSTIRLVRTDDLGALDPNLSVSYSKNGGPMTPITFGVKDTLSLDSLNDYVEFSGVNSSFSKMNNSSFLHFEMTGKFEASGSVMSLVDGTGTTTTIPAYSCFTGLFMNCQSLLKAPQLPATQLAISCYANMFEACTNLTEAPVLPAMTLSQSCYASMFQGCTSLSVAPELPATQLAPFCYKQMFGNCTALQTAPKLPSSVLLNNCYASMFNGCTNLNKIEVLFDEWSPADATSLWVAGVAPTGTFVCPTELDETEGNSLVPTGWTVINPVYQDGLSIDLCKVYDNSDTCIILNPGTTRGIRTADAAAGTKLVYTARYNDNQVAQNKTITVHFEVQGPNAAKYLAPKDTLILNACITPKQLTAKDITVEIVREYNTTDVATITTPATLVGVLGSDAVTLTAAATFNDKNVASSKVVTIQYSISGTDAANYIAPVDSIYTNAGQITPKQLQLSGLKVDTIKDYDMTNVATVLQEPTVIGVYGGDACNLNTAAYFDSLEVGTNRLVYVLYTLTGADAGNYVVNPDSFVYATHGQIKGNVIAVRHNSVIIDTVRVYDGTTDANVHLGYIITGVKDGDDVQVIVKADYNDQNAGTDKTITYVIQLQGTDAQLYKLAEGDSTYIYTTHGVILPRQLTAHGAEVVDAKIVDGTTDAQITILPTLHDTVAGDQVELIAVANYDNANVGRGKEIYVTYSIQGDVANYLAPLPDTLGYGIIYDSIRINSFYVSQVCEGTSASASSDIISGDPFAFTILWNENAHKAGLEDFDGARFMPDKYEEDVFDLHFELPDSLDDGTYLGVVRLYGPVEGYYVDVPMMLSVNGSSRLLDDIFTDVISIDNRENRFFSYQWYKDGEEIPGATLPYYQEVGGLNGGYSVLLNAGTESELMTCERYFELPEPAATAVRKEVQGNQVIIIMPNGTKYQVGGQSIR